MIQEKELRIGNFIYSIIGLVKVYGISENIIQYEHEGDIFYGEPTEFQPIELTEEILLKCGFIKDEFDQWGDETRLGLFKPEDFDGYLAIWGDSVIRPCQHLHQLQNLYFALIGNELIINI